MFGRPRPEGNRRFWGGSGPNPGGLIFMICSWSQVQLSGGQGIVSRSSPVRLGGEPWQAGFRAQLEAHQSSARGPMLVDHDVGTASSPEHQPKTLRPGPRRQLSPSPLSPLSPRPSGGGGWAGEGSDGHFPEGDRRLWGGSGPDPWDLIFLLVQLGDGQGVVSRSSPAPLGGKPWCARLGAQLEAHHQ